MKTLLKRTTPLCLLAAMVICVFLLPPAAHSEPAREKAPTPAWVEAMKEVHEGFDGTEGYVAQIGDSITYSMAFWSVFSWSDPDQYLPDDSMPKKPENAKWRDVIKGARDKGPKFGNYSGWRVGNLLNVIDEVLKTKQPEVAIIMIGTNDISGNKVPKSYKKDLETLLQKIMKANCVPILSTIPPRRNHQEAVKECNSIIRDLAKQHKLPLVDFYQAIMDHAPDGKWEGTLISGDGVHPSGGKNQVFSKENLAKSGYALRNYITFLKFREVYFKVLQAKE